MELIFGKEAFGIFAQNNKLYFYEDERDYVYFEYDFTKRKPIEQEEYMLLRYGTAYHQILQHFGLEITLDLLWDKLNDGSIITHFYQDSLVYKFDKYGKILWKTESLGFDTIYGIAIQGNSIWCAYPTNHTIKRYSLETFTEEVTIGDREPWSFKAEIFDHPEDVFVLGNEMYVSDMGNRRVCKIDLTTYDIQDYLRVDEPIWSYRVMNNQEFVRLDSGLYLL
ncbi:hypothetical protein [Peribacillus asahii]|uniref:hypothetical protein n=1 Tax=Peribacillus asahii TaxID=228899 RepID=UPI003825AD5A